MMNLDEMRAEWLAANTRQQRLINLLLTLALIGLSIMTLACGWIVALLLLGIGR